MIGLFYVALVVLASPFKLKYRERDAAFSVCQYNVGADDDCLEVYA